MDKLIAQLNKIEKEHPEFFETSGIRITEYITKGLFSSGVFTNSDLPIVIIDKIRKAFDGASSVSDS